jgi:hypothetical protein
MSDTRDPVLDALGALARSEQGDVLADPRWEKLAAGEATDEDMAALRAMAKEHPEARDALHVLAPAGEAFTDRVIEAIHAEPATTKGPATSDERATSTKPATSDEPAPTDEPSAKVVPIATKRSALPWPTIVGAFALAAAVALAVSLQQGEEPLPMYEPVSVSGVKEVRSDAPAEVRLTREGTITAAMRPVVPVKGALAARAWLVRGDDAVALACEVERSDDGAVRVTTSRPKGRTIASGAADLVVLVCRPDALPSEQVTRSSELAGDEDRCRSLQHPIVVE